MSLSPGSRFGHYEILAPLGAGGMGTEADEGFPAISPDGRMLAYSMSTSRGDWRVFVRPFPSGEGQREIAPGVLPRWSGDGRTLYYQNWAKLYSVSVEPRGVLAAFGEERPAFAKVPFEHAEGFYDVAKDGKRVAVVQFAGGDSAKADTSHVVLAFDWTEELKRMFEETRR